MGIRRTFVVALVESRDWQLHVAAEIHVGLQVAEIHVGLAMAAAGGGRDSRGPYEIPGRPSTIISIDRCINRLSKQAGGRPLMHDQHGDKKGRKEK